MARGSTIVQGLLAGTYGAGCMSVLRMAGRRVGLIDATPPQATKAWLTERTGRGPRDPASHQVLDSLIHLGIGGGAGALYGTLLPPARRPSLAAGAAFGLGVWAVAFGLLAPAMGFARSPRRSKPVENAVNVAAHLLYGLALAVVTGELARQGAGDRVHPRRVRARIG